MDRPSFPDPTEPQYVITQPPVVAFTTTVSVLS
jgi:hypothetical protein